MNHLVGHAPEKQGFKVGPAARAHDDEVRIEAARLVQDGSGGLPVKADSCFERVGVVIASMTIACFTSAAASDDVSVVTTPALEGSCSW